MDPEGPAVLTWPADSCNCRNPKCLECLDLIMNTESFKLWHYRNF